MALNVPTPTLRGEAVAPSLFSAESPITVVCDPVTFPNGDSLTPESATHFTYQLYRETGGGLTEVWNANSKQWTSSTSPDGEPLFYKEGTWQTLLVAAGQKDANGHAWLKSDPTTGLPRYYIRCNFTGTGPAGTEHEGVSPASPSFMVLSMGERNRAGLEIVPPEEPPNARHVFLYLKDDRLIEQGRIEIKQEGSGFVIELTANNARVRLDQQGDIVLTPAPGRRVEIQGPVVAQDTLDVQGQSTFQGSTQVTGNLEVERNVELGTSSSTATLSSPGALNITARTVTINGRTVMPGTGPI